MTLNYNTYYITNGYYPLKWRLYGAQLLHTHIHSLQIHFHEKRERTLFYPPVNGTSRKKQAVAPSKYVHQYLPRL